jgi:hypothetical protein
MVLNNAELDENLFADLDYNAMEEAGDELEQDEGVQAFQAPSQEQMDGNLI